MSAATAALARAGFSADRAAELEADGLTVQVRGRHLVVAAETEPLTGEQRVLVAGDCAAVLAEPGALTELRALAAERHPEAGRLVLRLDGPAEPDPRLGAQLLLRYVESGPPAPPVDAGPGWTVRPYEQGDREAVAALLRTAVEDGYRSLGAAAPADGAAALAANLLDRAGADVTVFCAVERGRFAGHGTVVWDEDDLTGSTRPELFDLFVLPAYRGTPAARLLTAAAVGWAAAAGFRLRGHVVGGGPGARQVYDRLLAGGWQPAEAYWALPVRRARGERRTDAGRHG